jgi:cytidylate kinase
VALAHVLWVGGPPCSGKTSIARTLAKRHDLRVYNSDSHTYQHHYRAIEARLPAATGWESMTPDERWLASTPEEMAELSLEANAERCRMILEDLYALPTSPGVIVEGTPLLPWLVREHAASPQHTVFLLPTPEFEHARLAERPTVTWNQTSDPELARENRARREHLVAVAIERGAAEDGLPTEPVDGSRDLDAMTAAVERRFAVALAALPCATTRHARRDLRRDDNETIVRQILLYLADMPAAGTPETAEFDFSCECGQTGCGSTLRTTVAAYQATDVLVHPQHAP